MFATEGFAFIPPARSPLPNFDNRVKAAQSEAAPSSERLAAADKLRSRLPQARVDFDTVTGAPKLVSAGEGFLSDANGAGRGIAAATVATFAADDPHRATKAFLREYSTLFGHGPEALESARVAREFTTPHSGLRTVVWEQQVEEVPVFEAVLISHTTRQGELVNLSSQFLPDPPTAAERGVPNHVAQMAAPEVSARQAVALAARNLGEDLQEEGISPVEPDSQGAAPSGPERRQEFKGEGLMGTASARLVWLPRSRDQLALCWDVILTSRSRQEMYRELVDVQTGEVLLRRCLTDYLTDATYRVFTSDSPTPFSPGHSTPSSSQPPVVDRTLLTFSALNTNASPNGWIDDGVNETRGNNVDAHTDRNNDDQPDLPRPQGSPFHVFDAALDLTQSPTTYSDAAVVQLFFWNNFMHDKLYELGFTEAAGNFQGTNFGRGGQGNDAVQADAQDGGGYNNANFSTPPDGSPGRMQMYIFNGPTPDRDGDLDAEVVLHEYTHGLSNRRVGGGVGMSTLQSRGLGEGWSDFYPLALLSEPGDDLNGVYSTGGYLTYQLGGLTENYYYGIRRYPYCTDLSKNPLTFKDIDPAQASSHSGVPRSPIIGGAASEEHNMGEVWCMVLWEARANLIAKHGWAIGNQLVLQLVTDGMNLSPPNPNFLQARDAILQADQVANGGANRAELWAAFAKRGMGYGATSPSSSTTVGLHEAYDVPDALVILPALLSASGPVGGPFTPNPAWFTLTNSGSNALSWTLANTSVWVTVAPTGGALEVGMATNVAVTVTPAANSCAPGIYSAGFWFTNQTSGVVQPGTFALAVVGRHMFDDFDPGLDVSQWSSLGGTMGSTVLANNYGGSVSAPNSLWFGDGGVRYATTLPINTTSGGTISFSLRLAGGSVWPWELVDLPGEGVVLECSTNSGTSWTVLGTYSTLAYYDWTAVTLSIPPVAQAPAALFRWRQMSHNGASFDHWALDDVFVLAEDMAPLISTQPQSQTVPAGDPLTLSVVAFGTQPLNYQWLLNGTNLDGGTGSSLSWSGVQMADAGTYSVLLSNRISTTMSSNALVTIYVPLCVSAPSGLVSWWAAEGNASDVFGTNNGVLQNGAGFASGRAAQGFDLTAATSYVEAHASPSWALGTNEFSIELWVKFVSLGGSRVFVAHDQGPYNANKWIFWLNDGQLQLHLNSPSLGPTYIGSGSFAPVSNRWYHVAITRSGPLFSFYLDGALNSTATSSVSIPDANVPLTIGQAENLAYLGGFADEIAIYSRALGASEIRDIYMAASAGKCQPTNAPSILAQPQSQTVFVGTDVRLSVEAAGTRPLSYQWTFNGTNLSGAISSVLDLASVQLSDSGSYAAVVTNAYGSITSSNAVLVVNQAPPCASPPSGLVSWWAAEGDALDSAGTNHGVLQNGAGYSNGEVGQALDFTGGTGYAQVAASPKWAFGTSDFSIELWVKFASLGGSRVFVASDQGGGNLNKWIFWLNAGQLQLHLNGPAVGPTYLGSGAFNPVSNRWYHVAVTRSGSLFSFYLDGSLNSTATSTVAVPNANAPLTIGQAESLAYLAGYEDEISIYNRALTAGEVQSIYNAGSSGKCQLTNPPSILTQPQGRTVFAGAGVTLSVTAAGHRPLSYQWTFNGTNLTWAVGAALSFTNAQLSDSGSYAVIVANAYGSVTSSPAVLVVNPAPPCAAPPSGLISWWPGEGTANDTVSTKNGTLQGGATFASGEVGLAFAFGTSGSYVHVPDSDLWAFGTSSFAIELWANFNAIPGSPYSEPRGGTLVANDEGPYNVKKWWFALGGGLLTFHINSPGLGSVFLVRAPFTPVTNQWYHLAVVRSGSVFTMFRDGVAIGSETNSMAIPNPSAPLTIGRAEDFYFNGRLDEVSVYNRALSAGEVAAIYSARSSGKCGLMPALQTPPSNQTVECSSNANFSVTATGLPPLAYQWFFGTSALPGATNTQLTLTNVGFAQAGAYSVLITNIFGSVTSGPALLTVVDTVPPTITACAPSRTLSAVTECVAVLPDLTDEVVAWDGSGPVSIIQTPPGGTLLSLGVTNVVFSVRDFSGNAASCSCTTTVADLTPPTILTSVSEVTVLFDADCQALLPDLTGTNYITASDNCSSVTVAQTPSAQTVLATGTNTVVLTVSDNATNQSARAVAVVVPGEPHISMPPTNLSAILTSNATLIVTACGASPLTYQWQHAGTNLTDATNCVLTLSNVKTNDAGDYLVVVANPAGSITSLVATLTVLRPPVITRQPKGLAAAPGGSASFSVSVQGLTPLSFQWQRNGEALAGQTKALLAITNVQSPDFATYTVGISNADGAVLSDTAILTLAVSPVITSVGYNLETFMLTVPTEVGPTYVIEYKDTLDGASWDELTAVAGTGFPIPITDNGLATTTRFYRVRVR